MSVFSHCSSVSFLSLFLRYTICRFSLIVPQAHYMSVFSHCTSDTLYVGFSLIVPQAHYMPVSMMLQESEDVNRFDTSTNLQAAFRDEEFQEKLKASKF